MIEISLSAAMALYSAVIACGALAIWLYTELRTRHVHRFLEKQHVWHCVFCAFTYLDEEAEVLSQCPRCQSFNSAADKNAKPIPPNLPSEPVPETGSEELAPRRNPSHRKRPHAQNRGPRRRR